VEDKSLNTDENARFSATILKTAHVQKIVLVTEAGHMPRSVSLFQAQGLEVVPAPTSFTPSPPDLPYKLIPSMTSFHASWFALYEIIGQVWYRIKPAPATANAATLVPPAGRTSAP
jgi:uncharacterized SAM-binding protein YcdF (DUF218 family)